MVGRRSSMSNELSDAQFETLHGGCAGLLISVGEDRFPTTAFVWALAASRQTVRFGAERSATLANLKRERRASLQIIGSRDPLVLWSGAPPEWRIPPIVSPRRWISAPSVPQPMPCAPRWSLRPGSWPPFRLHF